MKRLICGILTSAMIIGLCACGTKLQETEDTTTKATTTASITASESETQTSETEVINETDGEGWHYGKYYGKPWYVDDKSEEEIANIAYSYVTNEPKVGMTSEEYYSSFASDNNAERSDSAWNKYTNEYEGKGKPVTSAGFNYGYIDDVDTTKCAIRGISLENLWVDEDFKYAGSAYDNVGENYTWSKKVVLTTTIFAPTEELAKTIYNTYIEKYGAEFSYDSSVQPESTGFAFDLILAACATNGDYIVTVQHRTTNGQDYYELTFFKYF